ncbi:uncharacterized protein LOC135825173 [Sycon ciliatum]|uniref:uncharacterized protein LOC135825173 n=1 Tax=Sycon ciliatum TaxID=27933 RepID=UPI0031F68A15
MAGVSGGYALIALCLIVKTCSCLAIPPTISVNTSGEDVTLFISHPLESHVIQLYCYMVTKLTSGSNAVSETCEDSNTMVIRRPTIGEVFQLSAYVITDTGLRSKESRSVVVLPSAFGSSPEMTTVCPVLSTVFLAVVGALLLLVIMFTTLTMILCRRLRHGRERKSVKTLAFTEFPEQQGKGLEGDVHYQQPPGQDKVQEDDLYLNHDIEDSNYAGDDGLSYVDVAAPDVEEYVPNVSAEPLASCETFLTDRQSTASPAGYAAPRAQARAVSSFGKSTEDVAGPDLQATTTSSGQPLQHPCVTKSVTSQKSTTNVKEPMYVNH